MAEENLLAIKQKWPCRDIQIEQLAALLSPSFPSPPTIVVHGAHATGKTSVLKAVVEDSKLRHAYMSCEEHITERHLLERTVVTITQAIHTTANGHAKAARCETVNALVAHLEQLVGREKFVLVLDGIDKQREASPMLLPALARLSEVTPGLVTVLVVRDPPPRSFRRPGIAHIHFEPYTRDESLQIISQRPLDIFDMEKSSGKGYSVAAHEEDKSWLWPRYCAAVWDSLGASAARDLESFRHLCCKLWPPFIEPILKGELGTRNISRLMVAQRKLFQNDAVLVARLVPKISDEQQNNHARSIQHDLPYYAKWLLLAASLASSNPPRSDAVYFMKSTEKKKRRKGGTLARSINKAAQQRRLPRHLLAPTAFPEDRLLSILHAILPDDVRTNIDTHASIATLTSLRLLSKGSGLASNDVLEPGTKWRLAPIVSREFIANLAGSVGFELQDYMAE